MESSLTKEMMIVPSLCDGSARLGVPAAFALFMDIAAEHAEALGLGATDMTRRGLFWLTVKTAVRFHRRPMMTERVTVTTWPSTATDLRCLRYYTISQGDQVLAEAKNEWAILETGTKRLRPIQREYPEGLKLLDKAVCEEPFSHIDEDFSGGTSKGFYQVKSTDIDFGGHMNNAAYVRAIFSLFASDELKALKVREMEIIYRTPCFEGNRLELKLRQAEGGRVEWGLFLENGRAAALGRIN